jgi:MFS transporter, DHA2 family, methylenomycin A resistance protein
VIARSRGARDVPLWWVIAATSFGFVVVQLDVTVVNVALPQIAADLHASVAVLQWVVDAYALTFAVLLLSAGSLGDRFGAKSLFMLGFALFAAASVACGLAPNGALLVAGRAVQGIGAALLVPTSLALLNQASAHDDALRARAVALWTAAGGVSMAVGPLVGGLLIGAFGWRSIFWVNVPVAIVGLAMTLRVPDTIRRPDAQRLDAGSQLLGIVALSGLIGAVIEARPLGLTHPVVMIGLVLAVACGIAFVRAERRSSAPMVPPDVFRDARLGPLIAFGTLVNLTYYGIIFVLSLYLQQLLGYSAIRAGVAYIPLTATFIVSNVASGWLTGRTGARIPMAAGAIVGALGFALLLRLDASSTYATMLVAFLLIPTGIGLAVPAMTTATLAAVDRKWAGTASALLNTARQAGGATGVAIFGALVGGGRNAIVSGLHWASLASTVMLLGAAALAWRGVAGRARGLALDSGHQPPY